MLRFYQIDISIGRGLKTKKILLVIIRNDFYLKKNLPK